MKLRFERKRQENDDIWSFFFKPIDPVKWVAGQSIRLELPKPTWGIDDRRFSIASAPHEKVIQITTRISKSSFKQSLKNLKSGVIIDGHAVEGDFVWGKSRKHRLFIAGGIGITPIRAIISDRINTNKPLNATLLYSSRVNPPVFKNEIDNWLKKDKTFNVRYVINDRIEVDKNSTITDFWRHCLIYISGPTQMVDNLSEHLIQQGVTENNLVRDWFTGAVL